MYHLLWRSLSCRKGQSTATILAVAVAVAILASAALLYQGVAGGLAKAEERMGADILVIPGDVILEPGAVLFTGAPVNAYFAAETLTKIRQIPTVERATPQFFSQTVPGICCNLDLPVRIIGFDPDSDWIISSFLPEGAKRALQAQEAVLGAEVDSGPYLQVLGQQLKVAAVLGHTGSSLDYSILLPLAAARQLAGESPRLAEVWAAAGSPAQLLSAVLVQAAPGSDQEALLTAIHSKGYFRVIVPADVMRQQRQQLHLLLCLLLLTGFLALLAALVQLFIRFYTQTKERQGEWGLYLALGAAGKDIACLIIAEALVLTLAGALTGLMLGAVLANVILTVLKASYAFPWQSPDLLFAFALTALTLLFFAGAGVAAAWLPAYQGSQSEPAGIMTKGEYE